jgi:hypothetical protein
MLITKHQVGVSKHIDNYSVAAVVGPNARWLWRTWSRPRLAE